MNKEPNLPEQRGGYSDTLPVLSEYQTELFYARLDRVGACWLWTGPKNEKGYGRITVTGENGVPRKWYVHRLAYALAYGRFENKLCVCHSCDTPACCNPKHLFLGTVQDNNRDCFLKGRVNSPKGEANGRSKLTEELVTRIRFEDLKNVSNKNLSKTFGVAPSQFSRLRRNLTWKAPTTKNTKK